MEYARWRHLDKLALNKIRVIHLDWLSESFSEEKIVSLGQFVWKLLTRVWEFSSVRILCELLSKLKMLITFIMAIDINMFGWVIIDTNFHLILCVFSKISKKFRYYSNIISKSKMKMEPNRKSKHKMNPIVLSLSLSILSRLHYFFFVVVLANSINSWRRWGQVRNFISKWNEENGRNPRKIWTQNEWDIKKRHIFFEICFLIIILLVMMW